MQRPTVALALLALACSARVGVAQVATPAPASEPAARPAAPDPIAPRPFSVEEQRRIRRTQRHVRAASRQYGVQPAMINGIIWVESKFESRARGRKGPRGLMQIMPRTGRALAREMGRRYRPYSASFSVHAGTLYYARMLERFDGDVALSLAAYNRGPGAVKRWQAEGEPLPEQSRRYVGRVLGAAEVFRRQGESAKGSPAQ